MSFVNNLTDEEFQTLLAEENEHHRLMMEQEEAIKRARAVGSFVTMYVGKDGVKHYKASCDLTQDDVRQSRTICCTGSVSNPYGKGGIS